MEVKPSLKSIGVHKRNISTAPKIETKGDLSNKRSNSLMFGTRNKRMHASQGMAPADNQTLSEAALLS